jgi:D-sedoheptulose 7-phosphate isomerase
MKKENFLENYYKKILKEHVSIFNELLIYEDDVTKIANAIYDCFLNSGKLMLCGNGGSAADSQHIAAEFIGKFEIERDPLPAIALTTDSSVITCVSNDFNYDQIFSRQIQTLGLSDDCLLVISTSGNSKNILKALETANKIGIQTIGFLGNNGGKAASLCDYKINIKSKTTARIQEAHIFLLHALCGIIDQKIIK